jgi:hypothetical protein
MTTRAMAVKVTMIAIVSNNLDIGGAWKLEFMFCFKRKYFDLKKILNIYIFNIFFYNFNILVLNMKKIF